MRIALALADATGTVQTSYTYDPFGATTVGGTSNANPYQFTGRENDGTGLYFYRARYYSPTFQRFVSQDPIGFGGSDTNVYGYAGEDPVDSRDPSGLLYWNGNWGGPGWSGGEGGEMQNMTIEQLLQLKPAINEEDQCYEDHDFCFSECETSGGGSCSSSGGLSCGQVCNANVVHCLQGLHKQSAWSWLATFYFMTHDPNPTPGFWDRHFNFPWHP